MYCNLHKAITNKCTKIISKKPADTCELPIERVGKILTKFDLDSLNASEEERKLVKVFAQINLSLLIAYFSSMLSEIAHIILEFGGCQGWALTSMPPPMHSRNPNQTL